MAPGARRSRPLWLRIAAGLQGRLAGDRRRRSGRARTSRSRLLPEGRSALEGPARALPGSRCEDAGPRFRRRSRRKEAGADGDADRDRAGEGVDGQGGAARPGQDLPPAGARRPEEGRTAFPLGRLLRRVGSALRAADQRARPRVLLRHGQAPRGEGQARRREDLPALEGGGSVCEHAREGLRRGALPHSQGADRRESDPSTLEALRADDRPRAGRGPGPLVRHHHHRRRGQEDGEGPHPGDRGRVRAQPRGGGVDGRRRARRQQGEARQDQQQGRLPGQVARLLDHGHRARLAARQSGGGGAIRDQARPRQDRQAGGPHEFGMTPPTVNAYYDPSMNEMVFPAGIMQSPFFQTDAPEAANYGGLGMVMGHELTHGFDDQGRQFDGDGNLREWWSKPVGDAFKERAECVAKQYDGYPAVEDVKLNGHLTLGENIADIGGLKMALLALRQKNGGQVAPKVEQDFFVAFAQVWCTNYRPEAARLQAQTNPHSTAQWRVNGPVSDNPEFAKAYSCKAGAPMVPQNRCTVW